MSLCSIQNNIRHPVLASNGRDVLDHSLPCRHVFMRHCCLPVPRLLLYGESSPGKIAPWSYGMKPNMVATVTVPLPLPRKDLPQGCSDQSDKGKCSRSLPCWSDSTGRNGKAGSGGTEPLAGCCKVSPLRCKEGVDSRCGLTKETQ